MFNQQNVVEQLKRLNTDKSPGIDDLQSTFYKNLEKII